MSWDDFDEESEWDMEDEEDSEPLILSIGEDGKADIHKSSDYIEVLEKDFKLIQGFIEGDGKEAFNEYLKKYDAKEKEGVENE